MTRVLIIGNSHSAALRLGWNTLADEFPDVDLRFFVVGGLAFRAFDLDANGTFRCADPALVPDADLRRIRLQNDGLTTDCTWAEHVLLIGKDYGEAVMALVYRQWDIDGFPGSGQRQRLSRPAFDAFCDAVIEDRMVSPNWSRLAARVSIAGAPYPAESLAEATEILGAARPWKQLMEDSAGFAEVSAIHDERYAAALARRGLRFVPQPPDSRTSSGFTRSNFLREAPERHIRDGVAADDYRHMNEAYGQMRLRDYLRHATSISSPT